MTVSGQVCVDNLPRIQDAHEAGLFSICLNQDRTPAVGDVTPTLTLPRQGGGNF